MKINKKALIKSVKINLIGVVLFSIVFGSLILIKHLFGLAVTIVFIVVAGFFVLVFVGYEALKND